MGSKLFDIEAIEENGKSNEWYTPHPYIEAACEVMGGIEIDPASCEMANKVVRAARYYDKKQNGLMQPWYGRVWLNPPFSDESTPKGYGGSQQGASEMFVNKLVREFHDKNIEQAMLLVNAKHDVKWFQSLWEFLICFSDHKVRFLRPKSGFESHMFGTVFVYLGPNESRFTEVFSRFGRIVRAIDTPPVRPVARELWQEEVAGD